MSRARTIQDVHRGQTHVDIPNFTPVFRTLSEVRQLRRVLSGTMATGTGWTFLYVFTPIRLRLRPLFHERGSLFRWTDHPAGTGILLPPNCHYQVDTRIAPGESHHAWFIAESLHAAAVFPLTRGPSRFTRFLDHDGLLGKSMLEAVDATEDSKPTPFWTMQIHGRHILDILETAAPTEEPGVYRITSKSVRKRQDPIVARVLTFFEGNLGRRVRLRDIAAHLHASVSTVSHRFRAATGEAPMQALLRMRLFRAKSLLIGGLRISDAAAESGFYDDAHFAATFRRMEGMSPSQFIGTRRQE